MAGLEQYQEILSVGNTLVFKHSERILGLKKTRIFRKVLNGGNHPLKEQILATNCPEIQKVYEVHDEIFSHPLVARYKGCWLKKYGYFSDEAASEASIGVSNAILSYRNLDVKLSTYITHCIKRQLNSHWRATKTKREMFQAHHIFQSDLSNDMLYEFVQPTHETPYDEEVVRKAIDELRPFERLVVETYLEGGSMEKLAKEYGLSRQRVNQVFQDVKERLKWRVEHHDGLCCKGDK
jgi:RNA polymerase sigma factor (sigma-70 family)